MHLLTLEYMSDGKLLLRLEHQFEEGEGMDSKVTVSLDVSTDQHNYYGTCQLTHSVCVIGSVYSIYSGISH